MGASCHQQTKVCSSQIVCWLALQSYRALHGCPNKWFWLDQTLVIDSTNPSLLWHQMWEHTYSHVILEVMLVAMSVQQASTHPLGLHCCDTSPVCILLSASACAFRACHGIKICLGHLYLGRYSEDGSERATSLHHSPLFGRCIM